MDERRRYHPTDFGDRQWARLLQFALQRADSFEVAVPYLFVAQDLWRTRLWPRVLEGLRGDMVDRHVSFVRWEQTREMPTQFVRFRLTARVAGYISALPRLEAWDWEHGTPEDPTFYEGDDVLLASDSAQGRIAVYADPSEVALLSDVGIRLIEPLGVQAEPWPTP